MYEGADLLYNIFAIYKKNLNYCPPMFRGSEPLSSSSEGSSLDEPDLRMPRAAPPYLMHQNSRKHKTVYEGAECAGEAMTVGADEALALAPARSLLRRHRTYAADRYM
jgi:hypothetical protein